MSALLIEGVWVFLRLYSVSYGQIASRFDWNPEEGYKHKTMNVKVRVNKNAPKHRSRPISELHAFLNGRKRMRFDGLVLPFTPQEQVKYLVR